MSEDDVYKRIVQFTNKKSTENDADIQHSSSSAIDVNSTLIKNLHNRSEVKEILLNLSGFLRDEKSDLDKKLVTIGKFLGLVCSRNDLLADKSICKVVVECLVRLTTLDSEIHLQARASNWAKSRLRHMLCDGSESGTCFAIKVCGFEETLCNDMTSEMATSYIRGRLNNSEWDDEFRQLLLSLDVGKLLFIPQARSVTKAVLHHNCIPNDTKHLISVAYNVSWHDQDGHTLDCILARIWLENLQMFETAIVDLMEILLHTPDMSHTDCQQLIKKSQITKACAAYSVLKKAAVVIFECFIDQSKGCPLVMNAVNDFNHSIREMENDVQSLSKMSVTKT